MMLGCKDGDVKIADEGIAMIFVNFKFHPICIHYFWDSPGVHLFCQKLGYRHTEVAEKNVPNAVDAVQVGICKNDDNDIANCTGGRCNSLLVGGSCTRLSHCMAGSNVALKLLCRGGSGKTSSCSSKYTFECDFNNSITMDVSEALVYISY